MSVELAVGGRRRVLGDRAVARAVEAVLAGEGRRAAVSVTFLGRDAMRRLNARYKGHDRPTDVIAFALRRPEGGLAADIYVCPWVARREALGRGIAPREEYLRLVVHGLLHTLGYDHGEGEDREASAMWRRQERYVRRLR